jgi:plasmid stabilization system protein ParE
MSRPLRLSPRAWADLQDAVRSCEEERAGRGAQLTAAVERALGELAAAREPGPPWKEGLPYHARVVDGFPYVVFHTVSGDGVLVLAVANAERRRGYGSDG